MVILVHQKKKRYRQFREQAAYAFDDDEGKRNKNSRQELSVANSAGGIVSTTKEITKFINALSEYKLISRNCSQKMTAPFADKFPNSNHVIALFNLRSINKKLSLNKEALMLLPP